MNRFSLRCVATGKWALVTVALCTIAAGAPLLASSQPASSSITVVNSSGLTIRHLYLSPPDRDDWGSDQLNDSTIGPGGSFTIGNVSCAGSIRVIGEDQDGCFLSTVVSCESDASWTIANDTARDCG